MSSKSQVLVFAIFVVFYVKAAPFRITEKPWMAIESNMIEEEEPKIVQKRQKRIERQEGKIFKPYNLLKYKHGLILLIA